MQNSGSRGSPGLDLSTRAADGVIVAELAGELGVASAPGLREQLLGLLGPGSSQLVIDLSRVSSSDASGLAVLVGAAGAPGCSAGSCGWPRSHRRPPGACR